MKLLNRKAVDDWCFDHAVLQGHVIYSVKGVRVNPQSGRDEIVNVSWVDRKTGEYIKCDWDCIRQY